MPKNIVDWNKKIQKDNSIPKLKWVGGVAALGMILGWWDDGKEIPPAPEGIDEKEYRTAFSDAMMGMINFARRVAGVPMEGAPKLPEKSPDKPRIIIP